MKGGRSPRGGGEERKGWAGIGMQGTGVPMEGKFKSADRSSSKRQACIAKASHPPVAAVENGSYC